MDIKVVKSNSKEIEPLRVLFLKEGNFQFIYNKCHLYGWADSYLYLADNTPIGYGANMDHKTKGIRDKVFEFYLGKSYRKYANSIFQKHCLASNARFIECQSNDFLLSEMLFEYAHNINAEAILFEDCRQTDMNILHASIHAKPQDEIENKNDCPYILKFNEEVVASGGFMLNYNMPYADLYYEVNENYRLRGFGSYFTQELKKEAYLMGRVPAARCNINNKISKAALVKAGFDVCGYVLFGEIKIEN